MKHDGFYPDMTTLIMESMAIQTWLLYNTEKVTPASLCNIGNVQVL